MLDGQRLSTTERNAAHKSKNENGKRKTSTALRCPALPCPALPCPARCGAGRSRTRSRTRTRTQRGSRSPRLASPRLGRARTCRALTLSLPAHARLCCTALYRPGINTTQSQSQSQSSPSPLGVAWQKPTLHLQLHTQHTQHKQHTHGRVASRRKQMTHACIPSRLDQYSSRIHCIASIVTSLA